MSNNTALPLIQLVKNHLKAGDHTRAKQVALYLVDRHPDILEGWLFMGGLADPEECMAYLTKAYQIAPEDPRVSKALAWAEKHAGKGPAEPALLPPRPDQPGPTHGGPTISPLPETIQHQEIASRPSWQSKLSQNGLFRGFVYMGKKALLIALTIFLGVFFTIHIMNRPVVTGYQTEPPTTGCLDGKINSTGGW